MMELIPFLTMVLADGILGILASRFITWLRGEWLWLDQARDFMRWAFAQALTIIGVMLVLLLLMGLGNQPWPTDWQTWAQVIFVPAYVATQACQGAFHKNKPAQ